MSKEKAVGRNPTLASRIRAALTPFASVGVAAVVLRAFLGGTLLYSGLDKFIFDPRFLQADGVGSIGDTLRFFVTAGGPLAPLVEAVALPQPVAIGVAMAFAQLLVGGSLLSGAWVRIGALLGADADGLAVAGDETEGSGEVEGPDEGDGDPLDALPPVSIELSRVRSSSTSAKSTAKMLAPLASAARRPGS